MRFENVPNIKIYYNGEPSYHIEGGFQSLFGSYSISTFVGYLMPNPFFTNTVLFQTVQFSISKSWRPSQG